MSLFIPVLPEPFTHLPQSLDEDTKKTESFCLSYILINVWNDCEGENLLGSRFKARKYSYFLKPWGLADDDS